MMSSSARERAALSRHFGENLVRLRRQVDGLSQEELSFLAALHRTEIGMLERGIRLPRLDTIVKLAGSLDVTPNELLEGMTWTVAGRPLGSFQLDPPSTDD